MVPNEECNEYGKQLLESIRFKVVFVLVFVFVFVFVFVLVFVFVFYTCPTEGCRRLAEWSCQADACSLNSGLSVDRMLPEWGGYIKHHCKDSIQNIITKIWVLVIYVTRNEKSYAHHRRRKPPHHPDLVLNTP